MANLYWFAHQFIKGSGPTYLFYRTSQSSNVDLRMGEFFNTNLNQFAFTVSDLNGRIA